ncbi:MAG: ferrous iron transport protein A [Syntrophales bacterium]|nr:ferrous iron transport protein A [Syntrophales bacterium]
MILSKMKPGQSAFIISIEGRSKAKRRLMDMGIMPGEIIRLVNVAPFNNPLGVMIRRSRFILRLEEADNIQVEVMECINGQRP